MVTNPKPTGSDIQQLKDHANLSTRDAYITVHTAWCRAEIAEIAKESPRVAEVLDTLLTLIKVASK